MRAFAISLMFLSAACQSPDIGENCDLVEATCISEEPRPDCLFVEDKRTRESVFAQVQAIGDMQGDDWVLATTWVLNKHDEDVTNVRLDPSEDLKIEVWLAGALYGPPRTYTVALFVDGIEQVEALSEGDSIAADRKLTTLTATLPNSVFAGGLAHDVRVVILRDFVEPAQFLSGSGVFRDWAEQLGRGLSVSVGPPLNSAPLVDAPLLPTAPGDEARIRDLPLLVPAGQPVSVGVQLELDRPIKPVNAFDLYLGPSQDAALAILVGSNGNTVVGEVPPSAEIRKTSIVLESPPISDQRVVLFPLFDGCRSGFVENQVSNMLRFD